MIKILCYILVILIITYVSNALRWTKSDLSDNTETVIETSTAKSAAKIDVSRGTQVTIIKNSVNFEYGITIYCFISGYNNDSEIIFIFEKDQQSQRIKRGETLMDVKFSNFKINFETNFADKIGLKVTMSFSSEKVDHSGNYYCKAINGNFAITSNYIEIRDAQYWGLNLFSTVNTEYKTDIKEITQGSIPQVLNCSGRDTSLDPLAPRWTKVEIPSPTYWAVCPILRSDQGLSERNKMNFEKCLTYTKNKCPEQINAQICPKDIKEIDKKQWSTFVNKKGDLIFTEIRSRMPDNMDSYSFLCFAKDKDSNHKAIAYFYSTAKDKDITKGITFDVTKRSESQGIELISPQKQEFILYARKGPRDGNIVSLNPVIYALYRAPESASCKWRYGSTFINGNSNIKVDRFTITFNGAINSENAGNYTMEIIDKSQRVVMEIFVRVLGPPILIMDSCMPPLIYVWAGNDISIHCEYKQRPAEIKLQINSQEMKLSDSLENSKANLKKTYAYLEKLNFTISPKSFTETEQLTISYTVYNLTKSLGQSQYQDHTVTFMAANDFGISVKSSSIYVVPQLETIVTDFPEKYNCTDMCTSTESHIFRCDVKLEEYANKELKVDHYWTINSHRLGNLSNYPINEFTPYFIVDPITKKLTMLPIKSNNTKQDKQVKAYLKDNNIECHVDIYPVGKDESPFKYYSTADLILARRMRARITLDFLAMTNASIYWIMALILGLLLLLILVVLVSRHCMRNKGETYQLDKLERKHGYNPEKEVQDEMFKPYERQENDYDAFHDQDDDRRVSMNDNSVGSNDDGELESYDLDPSNFNEDGSIIGKYGANPRSRAALT